MLAITDASAGADPLGYVISVTNDVVTVRSEPDGAERDYNTAFLQPYVGKVSDSARRRAARHCTRPQLVDVGHMKGCFKSKANKQKPRCRFRCPAMAFERSTVFINGEAVCDCDEGGVDGFRKCVRSFAYIVRF